MKNDNIQFNLQDPELPSLLKDARRNHGGMTVPEDFFSQFEKKMNAVIDADVLVKKSTEGPVMIPNKPQTISLRRWGSIAAAVAIVVGAGIIFQLLRGGSELDEQSVSALAAMETERIVNQLENIELPEQVADEVLTSVSDYEIFDLYCDL